MHNFLSNSANRQTNKQTRDKSITLFGHIITVSGLVRRGYVLFWQFTDGS